MGHGTFRLISEEFKTAQRVSAVRTYSEKTFFIVSINVRRSVKFSKIFFQLRRLTPKCLDSIRFVRWEFVHPTLQCCRRLIKTPMLIITSDILES